MQLFVILLIDMFPKPIKKLLKLSKHGTDLTICNQYYYKHNFLLPIYPLFFLTMWGSKINKKTLKMIA